MSSTPSPRGPSIAEDLSHLPEPIVRVLDRVLRRRQYVILVRGTLAVLAVGITALLTVMGIDAAIPLLSTSTRWMLTLAALVSVLGVLAWLLVRPLRRRMTLARIAQLVDSHHPEFEERVSSAVELLSSRQGQFGQASPQLLAELTRQATERIGAVEPHREFNLRSARPYLAAACAAGVVLCGLWLLWPQHTKRLVLRAIAPPVDIATPEGEALKVKPGNITVAVGDPLRIEVDPGGLKAGSAKLLEESGAGEIARPMMKIAAGDGASDQFVATVPRVDKAFRYRVLVGRSALSRYYDVSVTSRPAVVSYDVLYEYPAYTALGTHALENVEGHLIAPLGTVITLQAVFNKPIAEAKLLLSSGPLEADKITRVAGSKRSVAPSDSDQATPGSGPATPDVEEEHSTAKWRFVLERKMAGKWSVALKDEFGIETRTAERELRLVDDFEPVVAIASPTEGELRLKPTDRLPIDYRVREDYGLRAAEIVVQVSPQQTDVVKVSLPQRSTIERGTWVGRAVLDLGSLALAGVPKVQVQIAVVDTMPEILGGPQRGLSEPFTVVFDGNSQSYAVQSTDADARKMAEGINAAIGLLNAAKGQIGVFRPNLEKLPLRLPPAEATAVKNATSQTGQAEQILWKVSEADVGAEFSSIAAQVSQIAEEQVEPAHRALDSVPMAHSKKEQVDATALAATEIDVAIAALQKLLANLEAERTRIAKTRELAAEAGKLADDASKVHQSAEDAAGTETPEEIAKQLLQQIMETQRQIATEAAKLAQKVDQSGYNASQEHRQAADTTRQAADQLRQKNVDAATPLGKQAAKQLDDLGSKLSQTPPPNPPQDPLDLPVADQAKSLAKRQENLNEQLDALKKGDLAKALAAMQKDVADQAADLAKRTEKLQQLAQQAGNENKAKDAKGASDDFGQASDEANKMAAKMPHINNIPKISPMKFLEDGGESPSDSGGSPDGGQGTKGGGSNTGAGSSKNPSPSNNNINMTMAKGKNLGKATITADALLNQKPGSFKGLSGGSGTELTPEAAELLRKGEATLLADNNPNAKGFGGLGGGAAPDVPVPPTPPKEFGAQGAEPQPSDGDGQPGSGGEPGGNKPGRGSQLSAGSGRVVRRLSALGISGDDWLKLPSDLQSGILKTADEKSPREYRDLVRRYFQTMARRSNEREQ